MTIGILELHYKTKALEGVLSVLIEGLSISNPSLIEQVKRVLDENINAEGQAEGFVAALEEVKASFNNITIVS